MANRDFKDLLSLFNAHRVRYLIVGGYAVAFHARPRFTKDLDVWIDPVAENAARVWQALGEFGASLGDVTVTDFATPGIVFQMGLPPNRIDVITRVEIDARRAEACHRRDQRAPLLVPSEARLELEVARVRPDQLRLPGPRHPTGSTTIHPCSTRRDHATST